MSDQPALIDPSQQEALIRDRIEYDPQRPGDAEARCVQATVPVWLMIGYLEINHWSVAKAATAYDVDEDAVRAAIAFYYRHRTMIDARLIGSSDFAIVIARLEEQAERIGRLLAERQALQDQLAAMQRERELEPLRADTRRSPERAPASDSVPFRVSVPHAAPEQLPSRWWRFWES